ncbi:glycosyltransferase family 4 protein [Edwardsiella piscicida]|uniref:glycosyltransferase family 4 protein n=1 Tax=Edwardsiella piscicida TaxID=1263550 RepID=UPI0009019ED6|nr:glycosyltransferase family 4 protein [Edwardsiella piscicida]AOP44739.2 glycosyltransferase family 4 protein [Edwardsiella piscicida]EKS7765162.1 glycosyltransferase family 4 protein [Edwardsiella piscicida]UCQ32365.1 glycosyltransferase family 4 protein [Edwardsiella piscicida]UCQ58685.1 glycosyltransferase family 4 protein [Edwardsiella piscicida]WAM45802.1 glycosyltransferase family 4 protein [Edwardsiella piscicida]
MRNICFFVGDISRSGGTERVTSVLANFLAVNGYQVSILSLQCGQKSFFPLNSNVSVCNIFDDAGRGITRLPSVILFLRSFVKKKNIDVFINVESMLSIYSIPAFIYLRVRNICWEHFNYKIDLGKKVRRVARILAACFADDIITLTERDKKFWLDKCFCKAKVNRIYNPVPFSLASDVDIRKKKIMLAVGRLTYQKGFDLLLKSWSIFCLKRQDWMLRIVGSGEDEEELKKTCNSLGISKFVEFYSNTNNVIEHYSISAFYVMTSRFEGFPMVLLEAQEMGLPIIAFDCDTGPSEIVIENKTGWLIDNNDVSGFSDKVEYAASVYDDDKLYNEMVTCSIDNARKYHLDNIGKKWMRLLND